MKSPEMGVFSPDNLEESQSEIMSIDSVKERALRYLEGGELVKALDSVASDLSKTSMDETNRLFLCDSINFLRTTQSLSRETVINFIEKL